MSCGTNHDTINKEALVVNDNKTSLCEDTRNNNSLLRIFTKDFFVFSELPIEYTDIRKINIGDSLATVDNIIKTIGSHCATIFCGTDVYIVTSITVKKDNTVANGFMVYRNSRFEGFSKWIRSNEIETYLYGNSTATRVKSGVHNVRKSAMRIVANTMDNIENFEFQEMLNSDKTIDWGLTASFLIINPLIKGEMITKEKEALERIVKINPFIFSLESVCRLSFDDVKCFEERKWGNNRLLFFGIKEGGKYRKPFVVIIDEMNKVKEVYSNYEGIYRSSE